MRSFLMLVIVAAGGIGCLTEPPDFSDPPPNASGRTRVARPPKTPQQLAVAAIKKMRGSVAVDANVPGSPVIAVDLNHARVNDSTLSCIDCLTSVRELNLNATPISDAGLVHVKMLSGLQVLNLSATRITDAGLASLDNLGAIHSLMINNTQLSNAGLAAAVRLWPNLDTLGIFHTQVNDDGIAAIRPLKRLQRLNLGGPITDRGLAYLAEMPNLHELGLFQTQATEGGIQDLQRALPRLIIASQR